MVIVETTQLCPVAGKQPETICKQVGMIALSKNYLHIQALASCLWSTDPASYRILAHSWGPSRTFYFTICDRLNQGTPKDSHILISGSCKCYFLWLSKREKERSLQMCLKILRWEEFFLNYLGRAQMQPHLS